MLEIGSLVDGKYKILSEVGHGGMSVVYLAINERANKTWAIKEVRKDGVCDFEAVRQGLIVETDMLKKLNHPNLPSIIDVIDTEECFLIVMDYVEGKSLQKVMELNGPQPVEVVINWGKQLCDVLGYLHNQNPPIIYRDMKPANIMLKPDGNITLIDFGTAREFKFREMVQDTVVLGTRGYAPPEQYGGAGQTDARSDIYSVGATLYYLLTGHNPAQPPYEIKHLRYWDMAFAGSGIEKIVDRCCQQDANMRYQSAAELYYALDHAKDADDAALRARNAKWAAFLVSLGVCVLGMIGMVAFSLAKSNAQSNTYSYYVEQAREGSAFSEILSYCKDANLIRPEQPDAYQVLCDLVLSEKYGSFDDNVLELIAMLNYNDNGLKMQAQAPDVYDRILYNIGFGYVFLTHSEPNWVAGASYLGRVLDSGALDEQERVIARVCYTIGENFGQLEGTTGKNNSGLVAGDTFTYADFWAAMEELVTRETMEALDPNFRLALCKQPAYYISVWCDGFKSYGVKREQVNGMLELLRQIVEESKNNQPNITQLYDRAMAAIAAAQKQANSTYQETMGGS